MCDYLKSVKKLCTEHNVKPLYISYFGSKLYGTNNEKSDTDFKGIFLPSKNSMLLGNNSTTLSFSSGNDKEKNTSEDIDIELYSLQYFLKMLKGGNTVSLDLLFSFTNKDAILYSTKEIEYLFNNYKYFFNPGNIKAFLGYAQGQAKKYSIKAQYLDVLLKIKRFLDDNKQYSEMKLEDFIPELLSKCKYGTLCFEKEENGIKFLHLIGSSHLFSISYEELYKRVDTHINRYGDRTKIALEMTDDNIKELLNYLTKCDENDEFINHVHKYENIFTVTDECIVYKNKVFSKTESVKEIISFFKSTYSDWKAISHSLRVLYQSKELITTGKITFPLKEAEYVKKVKEGKIDFSEVSDISTSLLDEVSEMFNTYDIKNQYDEELVNNYIISLY